MVVVVVAVDIVKGGDSDDSIGVMIMEIIKMVMNMWRCKKYVTQLRKN